MTFEDWFNEQQAFSLRSEWFYEDLHSGRGENPEAIVKWLRAAYTAGREHENLDWIQSHWDHDKA